MNYLRRGVISGMLAVGVGFFGVGAASAERYTSPSYTIDASVGNSFGGSQSSTNYKLVSSGGESIIGSGAGGSYILGAGYIAQLDKALSVTVQPGSLYAHYPFEEISGSGIVEMIADGSGGTVADGTRVAGKIGNALSFNGSSSQASITAVPSTPSSHTATVWIKPGTASQAAGAKVLSSAGFSLTYDATGRLEYSISSCNFADTNPLTSTTQVTNTSSWYFITLVRQGTGAKLYVNGTEEASTGGCDGAGSLSYLNVGGGSPFYSGIVDELKVFGTALNAAQIKAEYDAGNAGTDAGLAFAGDLVAGVSQNLTAVATVETDAPGYSLLVNQDGDLASGGSTIPPITNGGTIASPATWTEGTTKGLGFTLTFANATALPGKWGTNPNYAYAAVPASATTAYTRTGYTTGGKDKLNFQYRVDIPTNQTAGNYTNVVTYTGVMTP